MSFDVTSALAARISEISKLVHFDILPDPQVWLFPTFKPPLPCPFASEFLTSFYFYTLRGMVPVVFAMVYFSSVHLLNNLIVKRQKTLGVKVAPFAITKTRGFKLFVLAHNIGLCAYSLWTLVGMTSTMYKVYLNFKEGLGNFKHFNRGEIFWEAVCDIDKGIWFNNAEQNIKGLGFYAFWFYISKFYEIVDTIIILLKGKEASLLQSYHHSGAMLSMWSGVRLASPPIWIFVCFNSFIHSVMYFYFTLSCLHVRVPKFAKQILTSLQIFQFIFGGSLAVVHLFLKYFDTHELVFRSCIANSDQALAIWINVIYLTPLTMLFAAFWINSYAKKPAPKLAAKSKKIN
ncbi:unnamed protein product [Kuraishia capsulata CBS 1993]|uniref:Elongation of fatty acids protein n=1 Tax=Kuraishia capsulata CBS 1993 TaxID=1382522 RepID=W6MHT2_9ASCO|nr:uncharacterized protein KUCA_T00001322001 [Kuraishia capsulata CBS 1993]CDK25353.1 unnamed protein product [Kuraishia capsulata CBS 1993]